MSVVGCSMDCGLAECSRLLSKSGIVSAGEVLLRIEPSSSSPDRRVPGLSAIEGSTISVYSDEFETGSVIKVVEEG